MQLEEKRRRVMAKFKEAAHQPRRNVDEVRQRKARRGVEAEKLVTSTTDSFKGKVKQSQAVEDNKAADAKETGPQQLASEKTGDGKLEEDLKDARRVKIRTSMRKKTARDEQQTDKTEGGAENESASRNVNKEAVMQTGTKEAAPMSAENSKGISKTKVELVKRDLFSDEEANDQRTTRSQAARRTVDNQDANLSTLEAAKEKIPGVLECLQLIPANKSEQELLDLSGKSSSSEGLSNSQSNALDVSVAYDESVPIKKRKRKYSNSELSNEYTFRYPDEVHILSVTAYDEIFRIAPKTKKKIQSPKKSPAKIKGIKIGDKNVEQALGSSSILNSSSIRNVRIHSDNQKRKSSKKRTSPIKECKQVLNYV
jgi:hypothetical protein